jgi:outer membrane protein
MARADLIDTFKLALTNDPTYQEIVAQTLSTVDDIAISRAALLPTISLRAIPKYDRLLANGAIVRSNIFPPKNNLTSFDTKLTLNQTVFNFAQFARLGNAKASARQANAKLNAAMQRLMIRIARAYFNVLYAKENLAYYEANKRALSKQLSRVAQLYKAGSRTMTDVYTAQAAYGSAENGYVTAQTQLDIDREFLTTITGEEVNDLAKLGDKIPFILPTPADKEAWVATAKKQNWSIIADQFAVQAAFKFIKEQRSRHLPTLDLRLDYEDYPSHSTASSLYYSKGWSRVRDTDAALVLNLPIYEGGLVVSKTRKAQHDLKVAQQRLEASCRKTVYTTRRSFLNILSNLQKIRTDKLMIKSAASSLNSLKERYSAGEGTIVDLLNQQEKVLEARTNYARHRYDYIINVLKLKNAAGTLKVEDLEAINRWLL